MRFLSFFNLSHSDINRLRFNPAWNIEGFQILPLAGGYCSAKNIPGFNTVQVDVFCRCLSLPSYTALFSLSSNLVLRESFRPVKFFADP